MKKLALFLALMTLVCWICAASAEEVQSKGYGGNVTWALNKQGVLTIAGDGVQMADYDDNNPAPWMASRASIREIVVEEGVEWIDAGGVNDLPALEHVSLPESLYAIKINDGQGVFTGCPKLKAIDVADGNEMYYSDGGVLIDGLQKTLLCYPPAREAVYYCIPENVYDFNEQSFDGARFLERLYCPLDCYGDSDDFIACDAMKAVYFADWLGEYYNAQMAEVFGQGVSIYWGATPEDCVEGRDLGIFGGFDDIYWRLAPEGTLTVTGWDDMRDFSESSPAPWHAYRDRIQEVVIEDGICSIGEYAFADCAALRRVTIPESVEEMEISAFEGCVSLEAIDVDGDNDYYSSENGVLFEDDYECYLRCYPAGKPDEYYCIPEETTDVLRGAFQGASHLKRVFIPRNTYPVRDSFVGCDAMEVFYFGRDRDETGDRDWLSADLNRNDFDIYYNTTAQDCVDGKRFASRVACEWSLNTAGTLTLSGGPVGVYDNENCLTAFTDALPAPWAGSRSSVKKIVVKEGVPSICGGAFRNYAAVARVSLPSSVTRIGQNAFVGCASLTAIDVADGNGRFSSDGGVLYESGSVLRCYPAGKTDPYYCVPDSMLYGGISRNAFYGASHLERLYMPEMCDNQYPIFSGCSALKAVYLGFGGKWALEEKSKMLGNLGRSDVDFYFCTSPEDCVNDRRPTDAIIDSGSCGNSVKWKLNDEGVLTISGTGAMDDYYRKTEYQYDSSGVRREVTYYTHPWRDVANRIVALRVEEGVTVIGNMAFAGIGALKNACLPASLNRVVYGAFYQTGLKDVYYNGSQQQWNSVNKGDYNGPLTSATFHWNNTDMPLPDIIYWSFADGTLTISGRGEMEDYQAVWESVTQNGETTYREYCTYPWNDVANQIAAVRVLEGVTGLGEYVFAEMPKLKDVQLPDSLKSIDGFAFYGSTALAAINIPAGVSRIGDRAFYECTALREIRVSADNTAYKSLDGALFTRDGKEMLCYGSGHTAASYRVPDGVEVLRPSTFSYCAALKEIQLPDSLREICNWAFGHTGLQSVVVPRGCETLGYCAFGYCEDMQTVSLPASLKPVDDCVFEGCPLRDVYYEGTEAQWSATNLSKHDEAIRSATIHFESGYAVEERPLHLPARLTEIRESAFEGGTFTHVYLGEAVTSIGDRAFAQCPELAYIYISDSVKAISDSAFDGDRRVTIACHEGSEAHRYAVRHSMNYRLIQD